MTTPLDLQFYAFFVMVLAGIGLGLLYDIFRSVRQVFRLDGFLASLGDILLGLASAILLATALVLGNWGDLRLYVPVGVILGLAFYHNTASRPAMGMMIGSIGLLTRTVRFVTGPVRQVLTVAAWAQTWAVSLKHRLIGQKKE